MGRSNEGRQAGTGAPHVAQGDEEDWEPTPSATPVPKATRKPRKSTFVHWRTVKRRRCRSCKAWTWVGFDADQMACEATVEAGVFLTAQGEARAVEKGRTTYDWIEIPSRRIDYRDDWSRQGRPAGERFLSGPNLVVVDHVCDRPVPQWAVFEPPRPRRQRNSVKPPF